MLIKQIQSFISVVEHNSFTEAAASMGLTQSAISQQIKSLEKQLGIKLLVRSNRQVMLTRAGEYFFRRGKSLLDEVDKLCRDTADIASLAPVRLRLGVLKTYLGFELQDLIAAVARIYPKLDLSVTLDTHDGLFDALRYDSLDVMMKDARCRLNMSISACFPPRCRLCCRSAAAWRQTTVLTAANLPASR